MVLAVTCERRNAYCKRNNFKRRLDYISTGSVATAAAPSARACGCRVSAACTAAASDTTDVLAPKGLTVGGFYYKKLSSPKKKCHPSFAPSKSEVAARP